MTFSVELHPDVVKYMDSISQKERKRCFFGLKELEEDPIHPRSGCDIKKMSGSKDYYRLRVGDHRFLYVIIKEKVMVEEAFLRGKGY
jgi:mRNA-degrading endonuclease RelE of RelBE toxin-antitoxin system